MPSTNYFPVDYYGRAAGNTGLGVGGPQYDPFANTYSNLFNYQPGDVGVPQAWIQKAGDTAFNTYAQQQAQRQYQTYLGQLGQLYGIGGQSGPPGTGAANQFSYPAAQPGMYNSPFQYSGYQATPGVSGFYPGATPAPAGATSGIPAFAGQTGGAYANYGLGGQIVPTYGGNPFSTLYNVKSPEVNTRVDTALSGLDQMAQKNATELDNFINKFSSNTPKAEAQTSQENSTIDRYYNGGVKNDLDLLSQQKSAALRQAGDRALDFARHGIALAALSRGGGDSSYLRQMGLDQSRGIESNIAMQNADDARRNYDYLQTNQLGLRGQRQAALDELAKRELAPAVARAGLFTNLTDNLGKLAGLKQNNTFYSVKKDDASTTDPVKQLFAGGFNPYS